MLEVIGGSIGFAAGRVIGGVGIAALGTAVGIPGAVVAGTCALAGAVAGNKISEAIRKESK